MYQALVNKVRIDVSLGEGVFTVDGDSLKWDCVKTSPHHFHILHQNKSYRVGVITADYPNKDFLIEINGNPYRVKLKDKLDLAIEKMDMEGKTSGGGDMVTAPMPGYILDLKVAAGDSIKAGDAVLVLEAMKMENTIKSPYSGIIKDIKVKKGDSVEKGQVLIVF